ncbi:hypothetical protein [Flavobacterium sp.]|uniref:hypothetical protein n=1 Tax=Flavobacterium sp. TaxID=239 RepID=UPI0025C0F37D|nr:hypothetical protein [Flavobacterium sp.]
MKFNDEMHKGLITNHKAQKMLNNEGINVSSEEAAEILSFLKFMANGVVKKFLN